MLKILVGLSEVNVIINIMVVIIVVVEDLNNDLLIFFVIGIFLMGYIKLFNDFLIIIFWSVMSIKVMFEFVRICVMYM